MDIFNKKSMRACICGKNDKTLRTNRLAKQRAWMLALSLPAVGVAIAILGPGEVLSRGLWIFLIYALVIGIFLTIILYQINKGHTLACAVRRSFYEML